MKFLPFVLLLASIRFASSTEGCVFNSTHCTCSTRPVKKTENSTCLRNQHSPSSTSLCAVSECTAGGHACDCLGSDTCSLSRCSSWRPVDGAKEAALGDRNVPCTLSAEWPCVSPAAPPSPAVSQGPGREYKMVQVGSTKQRHTLFNQTWQTDTNAFMLNRFFKLGKSMHDAWPAKDMLKNRQLNFRLYEAPEADFEGDLGDLGTGTGKVRYACMIINNYGGPNDGLSNYQASTTITSLGKDIRFLGCDDLNECQNTKVPASALRAKHHGIVTHSDGWCAGPIDNETGIAIKVTGIENLEGFNFLGGDGDVDEYGFRDNDIELKGTVDKNGLVTGGELPEIVIKPGGILVS